MIAQRVRIHKFLSEMGVCSRRLAEKWIQDRKIKVNDEIAHIGQVVEPGIDRIAVDGKIVEFREKYSKILLLNKPVKCLTARIDQSNRQTIYSLSGLENRSFEFFPVGRLDYFTTGLLLLSNDGELVNSLMHPSRQALRVYHVCLDQELSKDELALIRFGMNLPEIGHVSGIQIIHKFKSPYVLARGHIYEVRLRAGKNRVIRRIFKELNKSVRELVRVEYAGIRLPLDLKRGDVCELSTNRTKDILSQWGNI